MAIETPDDIIKSWLEITTQIKQMLSKSDPDSVTSISKQALVTKNAITREKFADLVISMNRVGVNTVEWCKKQSDAKNTSRLLKEVRDLQSENDNLKKAVHTQKDVTNDDMATNASIKDLIQKEIRLIVPELIKAVETKCFEKKIPDEVTPAPYKNEKHCILIEPQNSDGNNPSFSPQQWSSVLKGPMQDKLADVPMTKSTLTKGGKGYVSFPDRKSRDCAAEALRNDFIVNERDTKPKTLLPKMKICDIKDYKKEDCDKLKAKIPQKNPQIKKLVDNGATLDVIFIHEPSSAELYGYAVIRVDPKIREVIIKNQRRLFIDTSSFYMKDQIHVTQCFACQEFAHKKGSSFCTLKDTGDVTCLYCAGNHMSSKCTVKRNPSKYKCANCIKTKKFRGHATHTSTSLECPIHANEINSIIRRTDCDSKNYPLQRAHLQISK